MPNAKKEKFILCPVCGNKTRVQIREDTELKNFPLFCPKCHKQTLINAKQLNITKAEVPDDAEPITLSPTVRRMVIGSIFIPFLFGSPMLL